MGIGPFASGVKNLLQDGTPFDRGFRQAVASFSGVRDCGIALVDLTTGVPRYAGTAQQDVDKHVFSLAKIAAMVAAFRLRERLRNQFRSDPAKTADELVAKIEKAWKPEVGAQVKGRGAADFPNLRNIFDLSGPPWEFRFKGQWATPNAEHEKLVWQHLGHQHDLSKEQVLGYVFLHRLKLMVRMSDNMSAGSVINDVGLSYLLGTLVSDGLYVKDRAGGGHGLWLSNTYGFNSRNIGFEGSGVQLTAGATARSIAEFMTRMVTGALVDKTSSDEMLDIMKTRGIGYGSYFPRAVLGKNGDKNVVRRATHSKVGYWSPTENSSDAAIIESAGHDGAGNWRPVRYIAVLLNDVGQNRFDPLIDIMDAYVKQANGLK